MISLKNQLVLTYALFICLAVLTLGVLINIIGSRLFSGYARSNIRVRSEEIVNSVMDHYDPFTKSFDVGVLEAMGMFFVHQGYIVSIEDTKGNIIWDARSCDMQECVSVLNRIAERMEGGHRLSGGIQNQIYPLNYMETPVGQISIDTYGPFFYSESESHFLTTLNQFLLAAGIFFTVISVFISIFLASVLAMPILSAASAARAIAGGRFSVRIPDRYGIRELHELSRSVNDLAAELENGERWQKRLTSDIAHELRTPLTTLQGNVEAMIDGVWEPTPERLGSCHEEIIRLGKLVEDLNTLSILERENLVLQKKDFDLAILLEHAAEQFRQAAAEKGIVIKTEFFDSAGEVLTGTAGDLPVKAPIYADYDRLMQVLINLLSNAVKYTDQGSITIKLSPVAGANGKGENGEPEIHATGPAWELTVKDTGIGIPAEELPHIFERFYRSDKSRNRSSGGAGIGLTIAAAIVAAHGGSITVSSDQGSTFRVLL
ncbi:sensor histidine kinase [Spirochaetia bacterium]|nr:sensor histidine kinase [Spirochaetia bacterium]